MRTIFAIAGACLLFCGATVGAHAYTLDPYVVTVEQDGANVLATGSGEFSLAGLTFDFDTYNSDDLNGPAPYPYIFLGTPVNGEPVYTFPANINEPSSFGTVSYIQASSGSGDPAGIDGGNSITNDSLQVPPSYQAGTLLDGSLTLDDSTIASLGLIPGTYVWTWGSATDQSFTLDIVATTPLPATILLFMTGLGVIGLFGWRKTGLNAGWCS